MWTQLSPSRQVMQLIVPIFLALLAQLTVIDGYKILSVFPTRFASSAFVRLCLKWTLLSGANHTGLSVTRWWRLWRKRDTRFTWFRRSRSRIRFLTTMTSLSRMDQMVRATKVKRNFNWLQLIFQTTALTCSAPKTGQPFKWSTFCLRSAKFWRTRRYRIPTCSNSWHTRNISMLWLLRFFGLKRFTVRKIIPDFPIAWALFSSHSRLRFIGAFSG